MGVRHDVESMKSVIFDSCSRYLAGRCLAWRWAVMSRIWGSQGSERFDSNAPTVSLLIAAGWAILVLQ